MQKKVAPTVYSAKKSYNSSYSSSLVYEKAPPKPEPQYFSELARALHEIKVLRDQLEEKKNRDYECEKYVYLYQKLFADQKLKANELYEKLGSKNEEINRLNESIELLNAELETRDGTSGHPNIDNDIDDLHQRIAEYAADFDQKLENLTAEKYNLMKQLYYKEMQFIELAQAVGESKEVIEELKQKNGSRRDLELDNQSYKEQIAKLTTANAELKSGLEKMKRLFGDTVDKEKQASQALYQQLNYLRLQNSVEATEEMLYLQHYVADSRVEAELRSQYLRTLYYDSTKKLDAANATLAQKSAYTDQLMLKLKLAYDEAAKLKVQYADYESAHMALKEKAYKLEVEYQFDKEQLSVLQTQLSDAKRSTQNQLESYKKQFKEQISAEQLQNQRLYTQIADLYHQISSQLIEGSQVSTDLKKELLEIRADNEVLSRTYKETTYYFEEQADELKAAVADRETIIDKLQEEMKQIQTKLAAARQQLEDGQKLTGKVGSEKEKLISTIKQNGDQIEQLTAELRQRQNLAEETVQQAKESEYEVQRLQQQLTIQQQLNSRLQKYSQTDLTKTQRQYVTEVESLKQQLEETTLQVDELSRRLNRSEELNSTLADELKEIATKTVRLLNSEEKQEIDGSTAQLSHVIGQLEEKIKLLNKKNAKDLLDLENALQLETNANQELHVQIEQLLEDKAALEKTFYDKQTELTQITIDNVELANHCEALQEQMHRSQSQNHAEMAAKRQSTEALANQLTTFQTNCSELAEQIDASEKENAKLKEQLADYESYNYYLSDLADQYREVIDTYRELFEQMREQMDSLEITLQNAYYNEIDNEQKLDNLTQYNEDLINIVEQKYAEAKNAEDNIEELMKQLGEEQQQTKERCAMLVIKDETIRSQQSQLDLLQQENNRLSEYVNEYMQELDQFEQLMTAQEDQFQQQKEIIDNQMEELDAQMAETQELEDENDQLRVRLEETVQIAEKLKKRIQEIEVISEKLRDENIQALTSSKSVSATTEGERKQLSELKQTNSHLNEQLSDLQRLVQELNNQIVKLQSQAVNYQATTEYLKLKQNGHSDQLAEKQAENDLLIQQLDDLTTKTEELMNEMFEMKQKDLERGEESAQISDVNAKLYEQLGEAVQLIKELKEKADDNADYYTVKNQLEEENEMLRAEAQGLNTQLRVLECERGGQDLLIDELRNQLMKLDSKAAFGYAE